MENLSFERKLAMLALAKNPKEKAELLSKFSSSNDFHFNYKPGNMSMEEYMKQDKFRAYLQHAKNTRDGMKNKGWTDKKYQKHIAEIPTDIFLQRPEFSAHLPRKVFAENMRKFLKDYPMFRVDK